MHQFQEWAKGLAVGRIIYFSTSIYDLKWDYCVQQSKPAASKHTGGKFRCPFLWALHSFGGFYFCYPSTRLNGNKDAAENFGVWSLELIFLLNYSSGNFWQVNTASCEITLWFLTCVAKKQNELIPNWDEHKTQLFIPFFRLSLNSGRHRLCHSQPSTLPKLSSHKRNTWSSTY